ncbi:biglycan-like isoform X1 [Adelges cooleyi]|uniref:biglycan-like isoform X1 n=1 Tax=Adelges cooleyi TaxID=133065 RepID=UPI00218093FD|nr:biglycan-like isoform X1 [Adelges cooleyi]XP_050423324.1 biglycan-like isoform X1 [Adelges cooleyi]XP_050423332.1 biglycan-like isoform X1 [Adelges cooleyi]XP_050423333.1 biglycan-like isoform X1 [Adelges cooleyi]XP_050423334.1 biglycan-like isoform X1 [Adelges cooleyi]XP_050423341.1 biglycan-like isoform X1 [Adelges cooleyi]
MVTIAFLFFNVAATFLCAVVEGSVEQKAQCVDYVNSQRLRVVNCYGNDLKVVPDNVKDNVELFDLRMNMIRVLTNDSFTRYRSIKNLYLSRNNIAKVEAAAFRPLGGLEVLDMELNALAGVPPGLPETLKRLDLSCNPLGTGLGRGNVEDDNARADMARDLREAVSLQVLYMRSCYLRHFPRTGPLPSLVELDLTDNPIREITPSDLAPLCRLAKLTVNETQLFRDRPRGVCQCRQLKEWAEQYGVQIIGLDCRRHVEDEPLDCAATTIPGEAVQERDECMSGWEHRNAARCWAAFGWGAMVLVCAAAVLFGVLCLCWRRRNSLDKGRSVPDGEPTYIAYSF